MSKHVSLDRLRDISKQRSSRKPLLVAVPIDGVDHCRDVEPTKIEWPVSN